jgi:hypothetical protein
MPFSLTSTPSSYQRFINHIIKPHTETFVSVYLDDILILSNSLDDRIRHRDIALSLLTSHDIRLSLKKCVFARNELQYLGHVVSKHGQRPSNNKIKAVPEWQRPKTVQETRRFLGFCNLYQCYAHRYSHMAAPRSN